MSQPQRPRSPERFGVQGAPRSADLEPRRQEALAYLRRHIHDGDLTLEEYGVRVERVLLATSVAEVLGSVDGLPTLADPVTARHGEYMPLPADAVQGVRPVSMSGSGSVSAPSEVRPGPTVGASLGTSRSRNVFGIFSEASLKGRWRAGNSVSVLALFGGATIDLRQAVLTEDQLAITGLVAFGSLQIVVPPGAVIDVQSTVVFGSKREDDDDEDPLPGMPRVVVNVTVLFGDIRIKVRPAESSKRKRRSGRDRR